MFKQAATFELYTRSLARILKKSGAGHAICGAGVLVDDRHILTCAHVVAIAVGKPDDYSVKPSRDDVVYVDFPYAGGSYCPTYVLEWWPPVNTRVGVKEDVAVLELTDGRPPNSQPANLVKCEESQLRFHDFQAYGYPKGCRPQGTWAYGRIQDQQSSGRYQAQNFKDEGGATIQPGFSGAPVLILDADLNGIVGIVVESRTEDRQAFIIPVDVLLNLWDGLRSSIRDASHEPAKKTFFTPKIPQPNLNFTEREGLLVELHASLRSGRPKAWRQALVGLPGTGKTQLASKYVSDYSSQYQTIWWFSSEQPETLGSNFEELCDVLGLETLSDDKNERSSAVRNWFEINSDWLIVFDNAEAPEALQNYLPDRASGHVIITSRNQLWEQVAEVRKVGVFEREESIKLLCKLTNQDDTKTADDIANELKDLPLAIVQAGSFVAASAISLSEYLDEFKKNHKELLEFGLEEGKAAPDYPSTVATTLKMSFEQLRGPSADLLNVCAFLAPDNIPRALFSAVGPSIRETIASSLANTTAFIKAVATLRKYSLLDVTIDALSIHRLVQVVVRDSLSVPEQTKYAEAAAVIVDGSFVMNGADPKTWPMAKLLLPHALTAAGYTEALNVAPRETARLLENAAESPGVIDSTLLERSLKIKEATYGSDDHRVAKTLSELAAIFLNYENRFAAEPYLRRAVKIYNKVCPDHPDVAATLVLVARCERQWEDYSMAMDHLERALKIYNAAGGNDPRVTSALNDRGYLLRDVFDDPVQAEKCFKRALKINLASYGPTSYQAALNLVNLSTLYFDHRNKPQAEKCIERALQIFEAIFPPTHMRVVKTRDSLAFLRSHLK